MKPQLMIKTSFYITLLLFGLLLSVTRTDAAYVPVQLDSVLLVQMDTRNQSFDEALMMGLQLLEENRSTTETGLIKIYFQDCCITARVKMTDMKMAQVMSSAEFVRKYVSFE